MPFFDELDGRFAGYRGTAVAPPSAGSPGEDADEDLRVLATTLEQALLRQQELSWRYTRLKETRAPEQVSLARTAHDLRTAPFPGYPTDMQAQYLALMTQAHGTALITETIFEHRFMHVGELLRMGADIRIDGHTAVVIGPRPLTGAQVMGDRVACTQILVNLLNNAVKFTPPGGSVGLETLAGPENQLQIVVWDTGVGIPEDEQERIFDPSYRAAPDAAVAQAPGLGLGLTISRDLARAMGGDIAVSRQRSRFILSLPLAAEPVPSSG